MTTVLPAPRTGHRAPGSMSVHTRPAVRAALGALVVLWVLAPLLPVVLWSVAGVWRAPAVTPGTYSVEAFAALGEPATVRAALASLVLGLAVAAAATPLGFLGALAARRLPGRGGRAVDLILLAPLAIPPFALVMGANTTLLRLHVPAFAGVVLILVVTALPYTTFMYRSALAAYEHHFEDVARTLGAGPHQIIRHVRVPLLAAATARAFFLAFLVGWGDYIATLLAGGGQLTTLPMLLGAAASATGNEQFTAVLSLAVIVPPVILLAVLGMPALTRKALP